MSSVVFQREKTVFLRVICFCALCMAGCSALTEKRVVTPVCPPGMETVEVLSSQKEGVLSISELPPSEPDTADRLVPGDFIAIQVYREVNLSIELNIPLSGEVNYPMVGTVQLAGKTVKEIEADVKSRLEEQLLTSAQVTVVIKSRNKRSAYILGSVEKPGEYEILFGKSLSLLQAVSKAGGFSKDADRDKMLLMRDNGGKRTAYTIAYSEIMKKGGLEKDVSLKDGDILVVPERARIYVLGKVNGPGGFVIPLGEEMTLTKAISLANGFDPIAAQNRTRVVRNLPDGTTQIFRVNVGSIFDGTLRDPVILPGDTIFVPESIF